MKERNSHAFNHPQDSVWATRDILCVVCHTDRKGQVMNNLMWTGSELLLMIHPSEHPQAKK